MTLQNPPKGRPSTPAKRPAKAPVPRSAASEAPVASSWGRQQGRAGPRRRRLPQGHGRRGPHARGAGGREAAREGRGGTPPLAVLRQHPPEALAGDDALYNSCVAGHAAGVKLVDEVVPQAPPRAVSYKERDRPAWSPFVSAEAEERWHAGLPRRY